MKYEQWRNQSQQISRDAQELLKKGKPTFLVKFLIACGLAYEAWHSHSLYHRGLDAYSLYESWAWYAAWIPVVLMTGSSIELLRAPHKWLKSEEQRAVDAHIVCLYGGFRVSGRPQLMGQSILSTSFNISWLASPIPAQSRASIVSLPEPLVSP